MSKVSKVRNQKIDFRPGRGGEVFNNSVHRDWQGLNDRMRQEKSLQSVNISDLNNRQRKRQKEKIIQYVRQQESIQLRKEVEQLEEQLECSKSDYCNLKVRYNRAMRSGEVPRRAGATVVQMEKKINTLESINRELRAKVKAKESRQRREERDEAEKRERLDVELELVLRERKSLEEERKKLEEERKLLRDSQVSQPGFSEEVISAIRLLQGAADQAQSYTVPNLQASVVTNQAPQPPQHPAEYYREPDTSQFVTYSTPNWQYIHAMRQHQQHFQPIYEENDLEMLAEDPRFDLSGGRPVVNL